PPPLRAAEQLELRHRTVSCTGASTVACTGAYPARSVDRRQGGLPRRATSQLSRVANSSGSRGPIARPGFLRPPRRLLGRIEPSLTRGKGGPPASARGHSV